MKNDKKKPKSKLKTKSTTNTPIINKKGITKEELSEAIITLNGNISEVAKLFGYGTDRSIIYRWIAKWDLTETLKTARGYDDRLKPLIGDIAKELLLDSLLAFKAGKLQKQDVVLLIFALKSCADFIEAKTSGPEEEDNPSIDLLVDMLAESRQALIEAKEVLKEKGNV